MAGSKDAQSAHSTGNTSLDICRSHSRHRLQPVMVKALHRQFGHCQRPATRRAPARMGTDGSRLGPAPGNGVLGPGQVDHVDEGTAVLGYVGDKSESYNNACRPVIVGLGLPRMACIVRAEAGGVLA